LHHNSTNNFHDILLVTTLDNACTFLCDCPMGKLWITLTIVYNWCCSSPNKHCFGKMSFVRCSAILLVIIVSCSAQVNNCTQLSELEFALYNTDSNEQQLNKAFFPPRKATSRYIMVIYDFKDEIGMIDSSCNVTYIWAIGGFLLIQPPTIFQFLSLLFSYPANDISYLNITLPNECRWMVDSSDQTCSCKNQSNSNLDILTQQVSKLMFQVVVVVCCCFNY